MQKATETTLVEQAGATPAVPARRVKLAPLSLIAPPISWAAIFIARHISDQPFNEAASNVMIAVLWIGGAVTLIGLILAVLALRRRETESRPLAIIGVLLSSVSLVFYLFIALLAIFISI